MTASAMTVSTATSAACLTALALHYGCPCQHPSAQGRPRVRDLGRPLTGAPTWLAPAERASTQAPATCHRLAAGGQARSAKAPMMAPTMTATARPTMTPPISHTGQARSLSMRSTHSSRANLGHGIQNLIESLLHVRHLALQCLHPVVRVF